MKKKMRMERDPMHGKQQQPTQQALQPHSSPPSFEAQAMHGRTSVNTIPPTTAGRSMTMMLAMKKPLLSGSRPKLAVVMQSKTMSTMSQMELNTSKSNGNIGDVCKNKDIRGLRSISETRSLVAALHSVLANPAWL